MATNVNEVNDVNEVKKTNLLRDDDLIKNKFKYSVAELEASVDKLSVKVLLNYQKLDAEFCAKYILNDYCATCDEDTYICSGDVLNKQRHLTREELSEACTKFNTFGDED
jgi:hypothetical protein